MNIFLRYIKILFPCCILILIFVTINSFNQNNQQIDYSENYSLYDRNIYINGVMVTNTNFVLVYNSKLYFSFDILKTIISDFFASKQKNTYFIRRKMIPVSELILNNYGIYISNDYLKEFLHINNNVYNSTGNLYIDTTLPSSMLINGNVYYKTEEIISSIVDNYPDIILKNGRGAWVIDKDYGIEDDWGSIYKYIGSFEGVN